MIVIDLSRSGSSDISLLFDIGYSAAIGTHTATYMLCVTMLSKICNKHTRGTMFSYNGLVGSSAVLIL